MQQIVRWDPFRELVSIQDELNRLFGRTFGETELMRPLAKGAWIPPMDVYETDEKFVAKVELPGVEPSEVEVSVEDHSLTVSGEREFSEEVKQEQCHRLERRYGSFSRTISLPQAADTEKVEASFDKGVLMIEIPKVEKAKPKKVQVKVKS
jgi:HSP20 family protein